MNDMAAKRKSDAGVPCPQCGKARSKVTDSRANLSGNVRRRRQCLACDRRFTTFEQIAPDGLNAQEAAKLIGIKSTDIPAMVRMGHLRGERFAGHWCIEPDSALALKKQLNGQSL